MDGSRGILVNAKTELIRATVVSDNIQVLLRFGLLGKINLGVQNPFFVRGETRRQLLAPGRVNHAKPTSVGGMIVGIPELINAASLLRFLGADLRANHHEAGALERHDLGETQAHLVGDVARPVVVKVSIRVTGLGSDQRPAGDVQVDVLLILVVSQHRLGMLPAVEAADANVGVQSTGSDCPERFALAVSPIGALNVGGLNLAAVVNGDAVLVNKGLE